MFSRGFSRREIEAGRDRGVLCVDFNLVYPQSSDHTGEKSPRFGCIMLSRPNKGADIFDCYRVQPPGEKSILFIAVSVRDSIVH